MRYTEVNAVVMKQQSNPTPHITWHSMWLSGLISLLKTYPVMLTLLNRGLCERVVELEHNIRKVGKCLLYALQRVEWGKEMCQ